jgi:hypothetical protein
VDAWINTTAPAGVVINQRGTEPDAFLGEYVMAIGGGMVGSPGEPFASGPGQVCWSTFGGEGWGFNFCSKARVDDGKWHHVAVLRESDGTGQIYIDAVLDNSEKRETQSLIKVPVYLGADVRVGSHYGDPYWTYYTGLLDEVHIIGRALAPAEIRTIYSAGQLGLCKDAVTPARPWAPPLNSVQVAVPGTANPWLAGMPAGSRAGCFRDGSLCDSAPDQSPVRVPRLALQPGASLTFSAGAAVSNGPDCCTAGPDGEPPHKPDFPTFQGSPVTVPAQNGIGSVTLPRNSLVGIFLGPGQPDLSPAPAPVPARSPALQQVFLIGSHTVAAVPPGATRLYLGTMDGYHWSDNSGA